MGQESTVPLDSKDPPPKGSRVFGALAAAVAIALIGVFIYRSFVAGGAAPVPPMFDTALTLAAANERADAEGKLVFAVATADWCGPCQAYKRGALVDPAVEAWVAENAVPVYIDVEEREAEAASLRIRSIPATVLLRDGEPIASMMESASADELLVWARDAAGG